MSISFRCPCDETLEVDDEHAGRQVACPTCSRVLKAPAAKRPRPAVVKATAVAPPPAASESDRPRKRCKQVDDDIRDPAIREMMRKARAENHEDLQGRKHLMEPRDTQEAGHLTRTMAGCVAAMIGAVIWFVVGLSMGVIFFYPPVLFTLGLVGFIREMSASNR